MNYRETRRIYAQTLEGLEKLALRDFLAWWDRTEGTPFIQRRRLLEEPFAAIAVTYGEQAAHAAANYLFLQRSLDETLAGLAYPEVADPIGYDQAAAAFRAAMRASNDDFKKFAVEGSEEGLAEFNAKTLQKLSGALNRVVLAPARETISSNIAEGMRFARVPEPGACAWCLMIASRGAVFSKDTAGMTAATRYHDNCRCLAMEVSERAPLPAVNRELEAAWGKATRTSASHADAVRDWKAYLERRSKILQAQVRFPDIPGVKIPEYRGSKTMVSMLPSGETMEFPLPDLHQMPGHVLFGWNTAPPWGRVRQQANRRTPGDYSMDDRFGHRAGNRAGKSAFPKQWSNQKIVDAIRDVLESGQKSVTAAPLLSGNDREGNNWKPTYDYQIVHEGVVDGVKITARYHIIDGKAVQPFGYPKKG